MAGLIIAIFLGWLGGYRFYKKQYVLGFVYLLTFGIIGIGWIIDIIQAAMAYTKEKKPIDMIVEVKGSFAECKRNSAIQRKDVINQLSIGTVMSLETDYYQGAPYFQVVAPTGLDIGALPSEINYTIRNKYPNAKLSAVLTDTNPDMPMIKLTISK